MPPTIRGVYREGKIALAETPPDVPVESENESPQRALAKRSNYTQPHPNRHPDNLRNIGAAEPWP